MVAEEPAASRKKTKTTELPAAAEGEDEKYPVLISDELAKFFGTGEREMPQSEALKRIWDYIKIYKLKVCGATPFVGVFLTGFFFQLLVKSWLILVHLDLN